MGCCGRRVFLLWIVEVIRAVILANAQWSVTMPGHITALTGSCIIIPCQFTCPWNYQPKEVVWYQYVSYGYPLVYSKNKPGGVIEKFRYKTELVGNATEKNCSLKIKDVHSTQNQEKIYVWIDPDVISYRDYKFYDTTVTLNVKDVVAPPEMSVTGEQTEGKTIKVYCTAVHTCPSSPPSLSFGDQQGSIQVSHTKEEMGQWRVTAEISWKAHDEDHGKMVSCTITHPGNRNATMRVALIVTSSPSNVSVTQHPGRPLEGQPVNLSCLSQSYPPAKSYRWYRVQRGHMVQQEGESQNLYLAKVSRDTGYYSCSARNDFGEASSKIRLINIEYAPVILKESSCILNNSWLRCECVVDANPVASVRLTSLDHLGNKMLNISSVLSGNILHVVSGPLEKKGQQINCSASNDHGTELYRLPFTAVDKSLPLWMIGLGVGGGLLLCLFGGIACQRVSKKQTRSSVADKSMVELMQIREEQMKIKEEHPCTSYQAEMDVYEVEYSGPVDLEPKSQRANSEDIYANC